MKLLNTNRSRKKNRRKFFLTFLLRKLKWLCNVSLKIFFLSRSYVGSRQKIPTQRKTTRLPDCNIAPLTGKLETVRTCVTDVNRHVVFRI